MARRRTHKPLGVFLNGRNVGELRREATGAIDFEYAREWLDWENAFPVSLSLPLREDRYVGAPVIAVFDNLLPDSDAIRRRVATRVGADGTDAYSMLAALGHDCVGALQFLTEGEVAGPAGHIIGDPISDDEVATLLANLTVAPLGVSEDDAFRISIAGAQEKTALLRQDGRWFKPVGTTATTHILKPQIGTLPNGIDLSNSVQNEYMCLKLMEAFGVPTTKAEMVDFGAGLTLVVERFDRRWTEDDRLLRLPQEDCCQALSIPPTRKYQSDGGPSMKEIIGLLKGSDRPDEDVETFLRTNIAFWLLGATDGHAKNFSLFITPGGRYRLTPAYDVLTAQPSLDEGRIQSKRFKLAMSVGANRHYRVDDIVPRHFLQTAAMAGTSPTALRSIMEELGETALDRANAVAEQISPDVPAGLVHSLLGAIERRSRLLATFVTRSDDQTLNA